MGTATLGVQTIAIGAQLLGCCPVYGVIAMAVGAVCVAFATAEAQEALGYGNWLKDTVGMSDEVYNGVMIAANIAAIAINIVGVKQCFKEGTLVACLNENGEEIQKPIESIAVGTLVLAYDEIKGEKAYKPVVQIFKNETKQWCTVCVDVDGQEEQIVSTPGHKYYLPYNTENREIGLKQEHESYAVLSEKWVSAYKLKVGDKVLLSDSKYGIIISVKVEELAVPEQTYTLEVEDFHTYFVGENSVCVHNKNCNLVEKEYSIEEGGVRVEVRPGEGPGKVAHNRPHAHVSGNGPDTTVGLNKSPVNRSHPQLSRKQINMVNNNWERVVKLIKKVWKE